jgi:hypothetical protein
MRYRLFTALAILAMTLSILIVVPSHVSAQGSGKALIILSLEMYVPMGYLKEIQGYLASAGYQVTLVKDTAVTIKFLLTELNNYDLVIWRTNIYSWSHMTYWYVGEHSNKATLQAYAADVAAMQLDNTNGILGVSEGFFRSHFPPGSLNHIKLFMTVASSSFAIAIDLVRAGVKSVIDYYGTFSLTLDMIDYTTWLIMKYLAAGNTVSYTIQEVLYWFQGARVRNPLDTKYIPSILYMGDGALAIKL